jgi:membrane protein YqaA with SNARE-associated domain
MNESLAKQKTTKTRWMLYILLFVLVIALSLGLVYLLQYLVEELNLPLDRYAALSYAVVFFVQLISNLALFPTGPPVATSVMIVAATQWNPVLVALFASLGGCIGELSGYYVGYFGQKIPMIQNSGVYAKVKHWMGRYSFWAIAVLAFQPFIPFDVGGIVAGSTKMPLAKFIPALLIGKFPKYILICFAGIGLINILPFM